MWRARSSAQSLTFLCLRSEDFIGILLITEKANSELASQMVEEFLPGGAHFAAQQPLSCTQKAKVHQNVAKLFLQSLPQKRHLSPLVHTCHLLQMTTLEVRPGQIGDFQANCKFWKHFMAFVFMLCSTFGPPRSMNSHSSLANVVNVPHRFTLMPHE